MSFNNKYVATKIYYKDVEGLEAYPKDHVLVIKPIAFGTSNEELQQKVISVRTKYIAIPNDVNAALKELTASENKSHRPPIILQLL